MESNSFCEVSFGVQNLEDLVVRTLEFELGGATNY